MSELIHLETVLTREEAQAQQRKYADILVQLGLTPGATVGFKEVSTATGRAFKLYMRAPEWIAEVMERRRMERPYKAKFLPTSGVHLS